MKHFLKIAVSICLGLPLLAHAVTTIRILTAYSDNANANVGGNIASAINTEIGKLNAAFSNSGLYGNVAVVSAGMVNVANSNSWTNTTQALNGINASLYVRAAKDSTNSDVVMFLMDNSVVAGEAWSIPGIAQTPFAAVEMDALSVYGYAHELGHLFGARHQASGGVTANDGSSTPYVYGHGRWVRNYDLGFSDVCFHTIMSYASVYNGVACATSPYDEPYQGFSNPSVYHRGQLTGSSLQNNAAVINIHAATVASWRNTKLAPKLLAPILNVIFTILN